MSAASGLSFAFGRGVFAGPDEFAGLAAIWSFSAALTGVGLIITALLAERDRASLERLRAERRYAQIFDGSPQPLWVHDPDTLEFLLVNAAAVRQYGWSREEFLTQRVPALAPPGGFGVLPPAGHDGAEAAPEPFETRHQTRDGRALAVEVWTRAFDLGGRRAELVFASDVTERRALGARAGDSRRTRASAHCRKLGAARRAGRELHSGGAPHCTGSFALERRRRQLAYRTRGVGEAQFFRQHRRALPLATRNLDRA